MQELSLKFDPQTIEHLGLKMYSQIPSALAELIANAYDADAAEVHIHLNDADNDNKFVIVEDNGTGMSFDEINEHFLIIGRKKRKYSKNITPKGRKITGRKGLGKLALFGIGKTITIKTKKEGFSDSVEFVMDWDELISSESTYKPGYRTSNEQKNKHGTLIKVSNIKRKTKFNVNDIKYSISTLFNLYGTDFRIFISYNNDEEEEITGKDRLVGLNEQFNWCIEDLIEEVAPDYEYKDQLKGKIVSAEKPLRAGMRGITLYARGRQANEAGFFEYSEAGHTFSYLTGWVDADFLDDQKEDLISTNRQRIDWEHSDITANLRDVLHKVLRFIVKDWSKKRGVLKNKEIKEKTNIDLGDWVSKVPKSIKPKLEDLIEDITSQPEADQETVNKLICNVKELIPEYTYYHYRVLHEEIKASSKKYYEEADYYQAFQEAMKRYKNNVKEKSKCSANTDYDIMTQSFGTDKPLSGIKGYKRNNGQPFSKATLENIVEGSKFLSMGVAKAGRNVLSHEEIEDLHQSELFSEIDCLDILSLLSHLSRRLEDF